MIWFAEALMWVILLSNGLVQACVQTGCTWQFLLFVGDISAPSASVSAGRAQIPSVMSSGLHGRSPVWAARRCYWKADLMGLLFFLLQLFFSSL